MLLGRPLMLSCICEYVLFIKNCCKFRGPRLKWFMSRSEKINKKTDRRPFSGKYSAVMTPYTRTEKQVFWCPSLLSIFLPSVAFTLLSPSLCLPRTRSLSISALMSLAHCAERSGSNASALLALNSRDGAWDDKAFFFSFFFLFFFSCLLTSPVSTLKAFITPKIIMFWVKREEKADKTGMLHEEREQDRNERAKSSAGEISES